MTRFRRALEFTTALAETRQALRAWADRYDALADTAFEWPDAESERAFARDGWALHARVQSELGSDWQVGYYDIEREQLIWPR